MQTKSKLASILIFFFKYVSQRFILGILLYFILLKNKASQFGTQHGDSLS